MPMKKNPLAGLDPFVERMMEEWQVPGVSLAVVRDGEVLACKGYGLADVKKKRPATERTVFPICSLTKAFTAAAMGMLVDEGKLDWDRPVREYLPRFRLFDPFATERMTPRDLACHRCGLPRHEMFWYSDQFTREEMMERLAHLEPNCDLRTRYQYNNLMFMVAGVVIEAVSGQRWEEFVTERIFKPLGMSRTTVDLDEATRDANLVTPHMTVKGKLRGVPLVSIDSIGPAGSINASVADMIPWIKLHETGGVHNGARLISEEQLRETYAPHTVMPMPRAHAEMPYASYALGWSVAPYRGVRRIAHSGGIDGITTRLGLLPDEKLGVAVFTNQGGTPLPLILELYVYDLLLGQKPVDWSARHAAARGSAEKRAAEAKRRWEKERVKKTAPSHSLKAYAGDYEHPGYGTFSFKIESGKLVATLGQFTAPLVHYHYDTFRWDIHLWDTEFWYADWRMTFAADVTGKVASVSVPFEPLTAPITFTRDTGGGGPVFQTRDGLPFARK